MQLQVGRVVPLDLGPVVVPEVVLAAVDAVPLASVLPIGSTMASSFFRIIGPPKNGFLNVLNPFIYASDATNRIFRQAARYP